jgi:hypothetical protein
LEYSQLSSFSRGEKAGMRGLKNQTVELHNPLTRSPWATALSPGRGGMASFRLKEWYKRPDANA